MQNAVAEPIEIPQAVPVRHVAMICNILPGEGQMMFRSWRNFVIGAPSAFGKYALTEIEPGVAHADIGDNKKQTFNWTARAVASDLCKEGNSNAGENSFLGLFVCAGLKPSDAELESAHEKLAKFFDTQIEQADRLWQNTPRHDLIPGIAKRAATIRHIDRPWLSNVGTMVECPACNGHIKAGVAICMHCQAVLDPEKAAKFFPKAAPEPVKAKEK